jgi:hypothetical protein
METYNFLRRCLVFSTLLFDIFATEYRNGGGSVCGAWEVKDNDALVHLEPSTLAHGPRASAWFLATPV